MRSGAKTPANDTNRYGLSERDLTRRVRAVLAALEAENAELRARIDELSGLADRDPLIPVLNRRAFLEALQRTTSHVQRYGEDAAVLYIDLDAFKAINDDFGHPTGDAALRHIGRLLMDQTRESDVIGRLGGDEFGVILAKSNLADARRKAKSLAAAIQNSPCVHEGVSHKLSASIGVHPVARTEDAEAALARADEAMYANKKAVQRVAAR